jgi:DNA (cytosine-5)-methyltransferase 1
VGGECVFASEIDTYARQTYEANFKTISPALFESGHFAGDITQVDYTQIPDFEVLCAGFPCQPFSICGQKKGFEDTRGTLFFNICQIIQIKKPPVIFLENVKNLVHHDGGKTLNTILESLEDLGYLVSFKVLNAIHFNTPQNRERIIIVATKDKPFNFETLSYHSQKVAMKDFLDTAGNFDFLEKTDYTLLEKVTQQASGLIFAGYRNKNIRINGTRPNTEHLSRVHKQPNRIYSIQGTHPTLPSQEVSGRFFIYDDRIDSVRRLTLRECYRFMGYPESFEIHTSKAEAYKQIGNSVCIPMIQAVAESIKSQFFDIKDATYDTVKPFRNFTTRIRQQNLFEQSAEFTNAQLDQMYCG